jgi:hypothetical protein
MDRCRDMSWVVLIVGGIPSSESCYGIPRQRVFCLRWMTSDGSQVGQQLVSSLDRLADDRQYLRILFKRAA